MLAASKLLSNKGENSFYHLNESQLLEKWMQDNGHVMIALFLAWKGSRFNWHVEAAPTYLTNLHWLLTFGKLDQTNEQSQRVDVWKNFGQVLCDGSGLFLTCRERLRREIARKKVWHAYNLHYTDNQDIIMNKLHYKLKP
jgi:hypothetical protein